MEVVDGMTTDLERLKALAMAATPGPWERKTNFYVCNKESTVVARVIAPLTDQNAIDCAYIAAANPSVVLALIDRLERAESIAMTLDEQVSCLTNQRDEYKARAEHAEETVNGTLPDLTQCPMCFCVHDPRLGQSDPNDQLDDVLPLAPRRDQAGETATMMIELFDLPASLDLPDSEGGHHD